MKSRTCTHRSYLVLVASIEKQCTKIHGVVTLSSGHDGNESINIILRRRPPRWSSARPVPPYLLFSRRNACHAPFLAGFESPAVHARATSIDEIKYLVVLCARYGDHFKCYAPVWRHVNNLRRDYGQIERWQEFFLSMRKRESTEHNPLARARFPQSLLLLFFLPSH